MLTMATNKEFKFSLKMVLLALKEIKSDADEMDVTLVKLDSLIREIEESVSEM